MSRTEDFIAKNNNWADYLKDGRLNEKQVSLCMLSDIALSLAQIADKIGCDYEVHTEFVADNDKQARMVTVYHRRERK